MFKSFLRSGLAAAWFVFAGLLVQAMPAAAQVTSLTLASDQGDYIGGGQALSYAAADGTFTALVNTSNGISISFRTPGFEHFWDLDFAAPAGALLRPGTYVNATRYPFQAAGAPGLSVTGDGRGCNMLTGSFTVSQVVYGPGNTVAAFDATFEQHCEGLAPALRGQIRYNANVALYLTAPTHLSVFQNRHVNFLVTATDAQLRHVTLSATALPPGATFVDLGNNTGTFNWTPTGSQLGSFVATFRGVDTAGAQATVTTQVSVLLPPPSNDEFGTPAVLPSFPYTITEDVTTATAAPDDPNCFSNTQSVWFAFTPRTSMRLEVNTLGSNYDTVLSVHTGTRGSLTQLGCNDDAFGVLQSRVRFDAAAGTTYYFMVGTLFSPVAGARLVFNLLPAPPPFTFSASVAQFGSVTPSSGAVTLSGTVQCSSPTYVTVNGQLKQVRGQVPVNGYWNVFVPCDGVTPWSTTVQFQLALRKGRSAALFSGGKAGVTASAQAFDPDTGESRQINLTTGVTLRGR